MARSGVSSVPTRSMAASITSTRSWSMLPVVLWIWRELARAANTSVSTSSNSRASRAASSSVSR